MRGATLVRQLAGRALVRIGTPAADTTVRDVFGVALFSQGAIRVIDGRLFAVTHLSYGDNAIYGALMVVVGLWLIATRWRRTTWYGALAAALAGMFYLWLAVAVWNTSATSGGAAIVYAVTMLVEGRAWAGGRRWQWPR